MQQWFRKKTAARYCDISPKTLQKWFEAGLPHFRVGRVVLVKKSDLDEFIERNPVRKHEIDTVIDDVMKNDN
ncbi:helix-turn-helix domain-containing protein [Desulfonema magnum]|uniref:DNA-binding domain-containing protein n=1 Tax=Desulfonema magnum TaxID=45655 RepID=A0A975GQD6_9BACT|nr:helix-turn-helix domain-containing protein [Desulfonema magnum]QTA88828.1 DNA-binding domain-containing protein [Desulfonema magnum]